jgi:poly(3-hydroxybutyrate) depolymerase
MRRIALIVLLLCLNALAADKIEKGQMDSTSGKRTYYVYVPPSVNPTSPAPLLITLHGSGRNGLSLVDIWKKFASSEGFIVAGPDSTNSAEWSVAKDGLDFLHDFVEKLKTEHSIDPRRVYLFGHSAGAGFALQMGLLESKFFAAVAVHAGDLPRASHPLLDQAERKIPLQIQVGTQDPFFPLPEVRATRDALNGRGFSAELVEIKNHDHNYYVIAKDVNRTAWEFLKKAQLPGEPEYKKYLLQ